MTNEKVTLRDVAKAAGVAESTVSRALAGNGQIAEATRTRIFDAARALNYEHTRRVAPPTPGRKGVIGVVAALNNSYYPYLVDRLHDELDELGFEMILIIDELSRDRANRKIESLIENFLDGVIVTTSTIGSPVIDFLVEQGIPTVLAIRSNMRGNVDVVESDNFNAGAEAMRHLVELGHRKFGFLMGPRTTSTAAGRMAGARSVLDAKGITSVPELEIWGEYSHEAGYSGVVQLLRRDDRPTAIFCANDVVAVGALEGCQKMGLKVPHDISIIGVDDIPMASWEMISLTTVRQPTGQIGVLAARLIAERVTGPKPERPAHHILPTSIVRRSTTGPAPKAG